MRLALLSGLLLIPFALVACGGSDDAEPTPVPGTPSTPGSSPAPDPVVVDDEGYLAVICSGLSDFSDAVLVAETADEISAVVQEYIASLESVAPPEDLVPFHQSFIRYLVDSIDEPTVLLTTPRPLPEDSVRERLSSKEASVSECRDLSFFQEREEES
jgi:hypothetical protein